MLSPFVRTLAPIALLALLSSCNTATPANPYTGSYEGTFTTDAPGTPTTKGTLTLNVARDGKWTSSITNTTLDNLKGTGSGTIANDGTIAGTYTYPESGDFAVNGKASLSGSKFSITLVAKQGTTDLGTIAVDVTKK